MDKPCDNQSRFFTDKRWHDVGYWVVLVVACAIFLVMNLLTTFKEDDLSFALVEGVWTPIGSLTDIVRSFVNQFHHATGRTSNLVPLLLHALNRFAGIILFSLRPLPSLRRLSHSPASLPAGVLSGGRSRYRAGASPRGPP